MHFRVSDSFCFFSTSAACWNMKAKVHEINPAYYVYLLLLLQRKFRKIESEQFDAVWSNNCMKLFWLACPSRWKQLILYQTFFPKLVHINLLHIYKTKKEGAWCARVNSIPLKSTTHTAQHEPLSKLYNTVVHSEMVCLLSTQPSCFNAFPLRTRSEWQGRIKDERCAENCYYKLRLHFPEKPWWLLELTMFIRTDFFSMSLFLVMRYKFLQDPHAHPLFRNQSFQQRNIWWNVVRKGH